MAEAPDNLEDLRRDLQRAIDLIAEKTPDYLEAKEYYDGTRAEKADSKAARAIIRQAESAPLSFAHIPVDVIAEKVELASITASGEAAAVLETWADANDIDGESIDWIRKACTFGDYYAVTDPVGLDENGSFTVEDIDSIGLSPLNTIRIYDTKTQRVPQYGAHFWDVTVDGQPATRAMLYYDDFSIKLVALGKKSADKAVQFVLDVPAGDDLADAYVDHDGDRMLLHHLAIGGSPYGVPLHAKAYGPQDAITKISANNLVNVDSLGLPSRWALMDPTAEVDDDIDDDFGTDGPTTTGTKLDGRTEATTGRRVRTVPGAMNFLRGVKQTGTYEGAQSDPFLSNLDFYIRAMGVACGIALFELDPTGEVPSGESRRRAEARANRTANRVKRQATIFFREIADTVLALVGKTAEVTVTFNPSETATDKDGLELVALKVKNGVPLRVALLEAGYTDEQVAEWYPNDGPVFSPESLEVMARALQSLGQAHTLGAVTDAMLEKMLPELFEATTVEGVIAPLPVTTTLPLDVDET